MEPNTGHLFSKRSLLTYFITLLGLLAIYDIILWLRPEKFTNVNYIFNIAYSLLYFSVSYVAFHSLKALDKNSAPRKALAFMSAGTFFFGVALLWFTYYNILRGDAFPYPSPADVLFLAYAPCTAIAFWFVLRLFKPLITKRVVIESLTLVLLSVAGVYFLVIAPNQTSDVGFVERLVNVIYPLDDALLISLILVALRITGGKVRDYFWFFIFSFLCTVAADFTYSYRTLYETQWTGDYADVLFISSIFLYSLGVIYLLDTVKEQATEKPEQIVQA